MCHNNGPRAAVAAGPRANFRDSDGTTVTESPEVASQVPARRPGPGPGSPGAQFDSHNRGGDEETGSTAMADKDARQAYVKGLRGEVEHYKQAVARRKMRRCLAGRQSNTMGVGVGQRKHEFRNEGKWTREKEKLKEH
eukprot:760093-Hanusia_phi.AAC.1